MRELLKYLSIAVLSFILIGCQPGNEGNRDYSKKKSAHGFCDCYSMMTPYLEEYNKVGVEGKLILKSKIDSVATIVYTCIDEVLLPTEAEDLKKLHQSIRKKCPKAMELLIAE